MYFEWKHLNGIWSKYVYEITDVFNTNHKFHYKLYGILDDVIAIWPNHQNGNKN